MYQINEDLSIYATRGDAVLLNVKANDKNGKPYTFLPGDNVRFKVYKKKKVTEVLLDKLFTIEKAMQEVQIYLSGDETKFDEPINKPTTYWYEVVLNEDTEPQTIIGYDQEEGAKLFILLPEGATEEDAEDYDPSEDERYMDYAALVREMAQLAYSQEQTHAAVAELHVTPEMYGAIGDGVADDTEAIQAMLNDTDCSRFCCRGTYYVRVNTLNVTRGNLTVYGGGTFVVDAVEEISHLFCFNGVTGVMFDGVNFTATLGDKTRAYAIAIHLQGVSNVVIQNCNFENFDYDVKIDRHDNGANTNIRIEKCNMENSLMPIYVEHTDGFYVSRCKMSISAEATEYEHHIYGSSECYNHYISDCVFEGGIGHSINYYSAYEGESVSGRIFVENCRFFDVPCAVNLGKGEMYCTNINVVTEQSSSIGGIFGSLGGTLYVNGFNVNAPNEKLFRLGEASYGSFSNGKATVATASYNIEDGSTAIVENCDITIMANNNFLFSNNSPTVIVKNCTLTKTHDNSLGKSTVFSVRGASAFLKAIGNVVNGNDLIHQFLYNGTGASNNNMFIINNVAFGMSYEKAEGIVGTFLNNTVVN